jgi:acetyl-CoA C-acetyltransferase
MAQAVILSGCRTAIGEFQGSLSSIPATQLGAVVIKEGIKRAGIESAVIDEVIMGQVVQGGAGQAPARQAALAAGVPATVAAITINKVCGSGLKAVMLAAQAIKAGDADVIVAGGFESMSLVPYYMFGARNGLRMGDGVITDGMVYDGLTCPFMHHHMGMSAEHTAEKFYISRQQQDEYSANSQAKAVHAIQKGYFKEEIVPVSVPRKKQDPLIYEIDERPRADTTIESLSKLRPVFKKDGTVTAGNAPGLNDGAAAVIVASEEWAKAHGYKPMARVLHYASGGTEPLELFEAPIAAVRKLMAKSGHKINDYDLIEANEAFAVQAIVDGQELGWNWNHVNVHGGAIALGHPIGASGTRILITLMYALKNLNKQLGMATLCLGGGNAVAMEIEMV